MNAAARLSGLPTASATSTERRAPGRVLVVAAGEESVGAEIIADLVRAAGLEVAVVHGSAAAARAARDDRHDVAVVLTEPAGPGSASEICHRLARLRDRPRILAVSELHHEEEEPVLLAAGADDHASLAWGHSFIVARILALAAARAEPGSGEWTRASARPEAALDLGGAAVLVVEGDDILGRLLVRWLERRGSSPTLASALSAARVALARSPVALALIDLDSPRRAADTLRLELARRVDPPAIVLTSSFVGRSRAAVDAQADSGPIAPVLLPKPFGFGELGDAVREARRRRRDWCDQREGRLVLEHGPIRVELATLTVTVSGVEKHVQPLQLAMLVYMLVNLGRAIPKKEWAERVWRTHHGPDGPNVAWQARQLRLALGSAAAHLVESAGEGWGIGLTVLTPPSGHTLQ